MNVIYVREMPGDDDDVRVLDMFDEGGGEPTARKRKVEDGDAATPGGGGGGTSSSAAAADKRAARRAATLERRAAAKMAKDLAAEQKRAERTRMQVRAQALKLSRKMHAALAAGTTMATTTNGGAGGGNGDDEQLILAPIVSRPNGDLALSNDVSGGGDPAGRFEQSFRTLQQIAHSAVTPPQQRRKQQELPPPPLPPATLPGTPVRLPGVAVGQQQQQHIDEQRTTTTTTPQPQQPLFGAIRGGALPTYREYVAQLENRPVPPRRRTRAELELELTEDQRREQARLERELQELAVTQQYENLTRLYNTLPELRRKPIIHASNTTARRAPPPSAVLLPRSVPQQRRTVRRVFHVGRTDKELSLLTHSTATRAGVDDFRMHVQSLSTDKMRRALLAAKLLRAGSEAPEPLVRRIFQQRQMLVGDLLVGGNGGGGAAAGAEEVVSSSSS